MLKHSLYAPIDTCRELLWRATPNHTSGYPPTWPVSTSAPISVHWPHNYNWKPADKWLIHVYDGLAKLTDIKRMDTVPAWEGGVRAVFLVEGRPYNVVFDYSDYSQELNSAELADSTCYFKFQYRTGGYGDERVVPGGYPVGSQYTYRYLKGLRRLRKLRPKYDTFARFGLRYSGDIRRKSIDLLKGQNNFKFHGGTRFVRYCKSLMEAARSRVCIDMPGNGPFCFRLIDYLAMGACVVARRPRAELPVPLIDRKHIVFCNDDLSDLVPLCRALIDDGELREAIANNAQQYFDRYLHREQLAGYYLKTWQDAAAR